MYEDQEEEIEIIVREREPIPTKSEIHRALQSLSIGNSAGSDVIPAELLMYDGEVVLDLLHQIIVEVWDSGAWPDEWTASLFVPLPKKRDLLECNNYRTIALVSHASNIILRIILNRMQQKIETEIGPEQAAFRPRRGTRDHIVNLSIILEKEKVR